MNRRERIEKIILECLELDGALYIEASKVLAREIAQKVSEMLYQDELAYQHERHAILERSESD